jgi:hypothetical protein
MRMTQIKGAQLLLIQTSVAAIICNVACKFQYDAALFQLPPNPNPLSIRN